MIGCTVVVVVAVAVAVVVCHHYFAWVTKTATDLSCLTRTRPMELIVVFPAGTRCRAVKRSGGKARSP